MELRVRQDNYTWMVDNPMIWWAAYARARFGRVAPAIPGYSAYNENGPVAEADGFVWRVWSHGNIDGFDQYILDVVVAGKEYSETLSTDDGLAVVYYRALADLEAFEAVSELFAAGSISSSYAVSLFRAQAAALGDSLNVPPYVEPAVEDADILEDLVSDGDPS